MCLLLPQCTDSWTRCADVSTSGYVGYVGTQALLHTIQDARTQMCKQACTSGKRHTTWWSCISWTVKNKLLTIQATLAHNFVACLVAVVQSQMNVTLYINLPQTRTYRLLSPLKTIISTPEPFKRQMTFINVDQCLLRGQSTESLKGH